MRGGKGPDKYDRMRRAFLVPISLGGSFFPGKDVGVPGNLIFYLNDSVKPFSSSSRVHKTLDMRRRE